MIDLPLAYRIESEIEKPEFDDTSLTEPERENPQKGMGADNCKYSFEEGIEFANIWRESIDPRMLEPQEPDSMLEESYLLLPAKTYGYVFLRRKWCTFLLPHMLHAPCSRPLLTSTGLLN